MNRLPLVSLLSILLLATSCATSIVPPSPTAPIYEARKINLGGVKQSVLIRGENRSNPILMFVHGGPGFSEMPTYERNADLERDFVVVQWDQRGAGKSYRPGISKESMTVDQFVADTHQLTDLICGRLKKKKALLVGFSFGSLVGLQAVAESPERYHGYVGLSHFVTIPESEEILDIEGRARAARKGETKILAKLEKIGPPPYKSHPQERVVNALIKDLVIEDTKNPFPASEYIGKALWSKHYKPHNFIGLALGRSFSGKALEDEIYTIDIRDLVSRVDVPMLWISGKQDTTLSQTLAHEYFGQIKAPQGKEFIWLEDVAHPVHLETPTTFQAALRKFSSEKLGIIK